MVRSTGAARAAGSRLRTRGRGARARVSAAVRRAARARGVGHVPHAAAELHTQRLRRLGQARGRAARARARGGHRDGGMGGAQRLHRSGRRAMWRGQTTRMDGPPAALHGGLRLRESEETAQYLTGASSLRPRGCRARGAREEAALHHHRRRAGCESCVLTSRAHSKLQAPSQRSQRRRAAGARPARARRSRRRRRRRHRLPRAQRRARRPAPRRAPRRARRTAQRHRAPPRRTPPPRRARARAPPPPPVPPCNCALLRARLRAR